jgi:hypothetical protein
MAVNFSLARGDIISGVEQYLSAGRALPEMTVDVEDL